METCCKSFLAMCLQYFVGKASERPLASGDIMTTSSCLIGAVHPSLSPLRRSSQKPQHPHHTCAAAGPPLATLNKLELRWDLRLHCRMSMYISVHGRGKKTEWRSVGRVYVMQTYHQTLSAKPKLYANPLPR